MAELAAARAMGLDAVAAVSWWCSADVFWVCDDSRCVIPIAEWGGRKECMNDGSADMLQRGEAHVVEEWRGQRSRRWGWDSTRGARMSV